MPKLLVVTLGLGLPVGSYFVFTTESPTTFKALALGKGLIVPNDDNFFKAIVEEYTKDVLKKEGFSDDSDTDIDYNTVKTGCSKDEGTKNLISEKTEKEIKEKSEKYEKFCTLPKNGSKSKSEWIFMGFELSDMNSSTDEDGKVIFVENKHDSVFIGVLDKVSPPPAASDAVSIDTYKNKVKELCTNISSKQLTDLGDNVHQRRKIYEKFSKCKKTDYKTVEERLQEKETNGEKESDSSKGKEKGNKGKDTEKVLKIINTGKESSDSLSSVTTEQNGSTEIQNFCTNTLGKKVGEVGNLFDPNSEYSVAKSVCKK